MSGDVTAAIERLRKRPVPDHGFAEVDMADVFALVAEVERLRAERDDAVEGLREAENQHRVTREQWRVEREALHSDQTREHVYQAWHATSEPWGGCADRERIDRVLSVLTADPEVNQ